MPMPTNVSQLRSVLGAVGYYRKFIPQMSVKAKSLNKLLKKGVKFNFTADHVDIVQKMLQDLASPEVLAFPYFHAAISGDRPFRLTTDASVDGLGAVVEQKTGGRGDTAVGIFEPVDPP